MNATAAPTDRQMNTLASMLKDLAKFDEVKAQDVQGFIDAETAQGIFNRGRASSYIGRLIEVLKVKRAEAKAVADVAPVVQEVQVDLPDGRYAILEDAVLKFYQITHSKSHKVYVNRLLGAPGDWRRVRVSAAKAKEIVKAIDAVGALQAMQAFGEEFQVCGRCAAPLSDVTSRTLHICPECAVTMGMGETYATLAKQHAAQGLK